MKKQVDRVTVSYRDRHYTECSYLDECTTTRLSVFVNNDKDQHHIEFEAGVNRYELSGLLIKLAHMVARGRAIKG